MATVAARPADVVLCNYEGARLQPVDTPTYEQIAMQSCDVQRLTSLQEKWSTELRHLVSSDPASAHHLAEALDDLAILIGRLTEGRHR